MSGEFKDYLSSQGIRHEKTVADTPQQNGVAERMNRTLMELARSMIHHAGISPRFWAEAISTATYIRNRVPTSALGNRTPHEKWNGAKPDISHLKVFGCTAHAWIPDNKRTKLQSKTVKLRFVGYSLTSKGYRLFDDETHKTVVRRDVAFNEDEFGATTTHEDLPSSLCVEESDGHAADESVEPDVSAGTDPGRSARVRRAPKYLNDYVTEMDDSTSVNEHADLVQHMAYRACTIEPSTIQEALKGPNAEEWFQAADDEYNSLKRNNTWSLVDLPKDKKVISTKWVFKVKYGANGEVERYKARLVAQGFSQTITKLTHQWYLTTQFAFF